VLASLGSGAFHPAGTMQATLSGRRHYGGRETTAASYFFFFGQIGFFVGPLAGGPLLDQFGLQGLLIFTAVALPIGMSALRRLGNERPCEGGAANPLAAERPRYRRRVLVALALLAALTSWTLQNMVTYVPRHLSLLGQSPSVYGVVTALFVGAAAVGNVLGGSLADRHGKRKVASTALALACVPIYLFAAAGWSPWLYLIAPLAGVLAGSTHSIVVVIAQRIIPRGPAMASGLILGFMFSAGGVGALLSGYGADLWGLQSVFVTNVGLVLASAALTWALPRT